jgi:hypothetical protein
MRNIPKRLTQRRECYKEDKIINRDIRLSDMVIGQSQLKNCKTKLYPPAA